MVLAAIPPLNTRFPALNIALLAAELKAAGHSVLSLDFNIEAFDQLRDSAEHLWDFRNGYLWTDPKVFEKSIFQKHLAPLFDGWIQQILATQPQVVGISVTPNTIALRIAKALKAHDPRIQVIFGGPMCSKTMGDHTFQPNEFVDAVVSDEGEQTLLDAVAHVERTGKIPLLPGLSIFSEGEVKFGGTRPAIAKLDTTAMPDFSDLKLERYREVYQKEPSRELPIYTSRGCVGRCNFCMDYKMWAVYYRQKSPERMVAEMEFLYEKFQVKNFIFIELVFNGHHEWVQKFCDLLKTRPVQFRFWSHGRVDGRLTQPLLRSLRAVGFWHFIFGMESASDNVLRLMRKGTTKAKAAANLRDCFDANISVSVNVIVGFPGETLWDFLETVAFIISNRRYISMVPSITPCFATPGTDIYLYPEKFGIKIDKSSLHGSETWSSIDGWNTHRVRLWRRNFLEFVCRHIVFSRKQVTRWERKFYTDKFFALLARLFDRRNGDVATAPLIVKPETAVTTEKPTSSVA